MLYLRYFWYVIRHKWWVLYYAHLTGAPLPLALAHDISKFGKAEFGPYARWFYGFHGLHDLSPDKCAESQRLKSEFDAAWEHHKARNKHHPEYWYGTGQMKVSQPMPHKYILEMIADWRGAGRAITGRDNLQEWWDKNRDRFNFNWQTARTVNVHLQRIGIK